ncbi:MAG: hypothetical protein ABSH20_05260 [Tepidisphaeraceae bacterium]|jgi:hypothetical protein
MSVTDLGTLLGSKGVASEILHSKRALSKTHIFELARRFSVDPRLFLEKVRSIYRLKNGDEMLARFKEFNLRSVLSGHYHGQTESRKDGMLLSTGKCCSLAASNHDRTPEKGFFVCRAKAGRIEHEFVEVAAAA